MTSPATGSMPSPTQMPAAGDNHGRFLWYDLMTPDVDGAMAFYSAVTGWTTSMWDGQPAMPYTMWIAPSGVPIGGVMALSPEEVAAGARPHWIASVGVRDLDATYAEALQLGATSRVAPTDIPTVGRYAILNDPQGALFAIYLPEDAASVAPEPAVPAIGTMSWHELYTTDLDAAFAFYARLFGWVEQQTMDMGPMGRYLMYGRGDKMYGGMMKRDTDASPVAWNLYVRVADLDAAVAAVKANGGQIAVGPMPVPGGDLVAICIDPHGGMFALHQKITA